MFCVIPGLPIIRLAGRGCGCGRRWVCPRAGLHVMWFDRRILTRPEFNGFTIIIFIPYALVDSDQKPYGGYESDGEAKQHECQISHSQFDK